MFFLLDRKDTPISGIAIPKADLKVFSAFIVSPRGMAKDTIATSKISRSFTFM